MKRSPIDFHVEPFRPARRWLAIALILAATAATGWHGWRLRQETLRLKEQRIAAIAEAQRAVVEVAPPVAWPFASSAREMLALKTAGWPAALTTMESVAVPGVQLLQADLNAVDRSVRLELEAARYADVLSYVDQLNAGEPAGRWRLVSVQSTSATSGQISSLETRLTATVSSQLD